MLEDNYIVQLQPDKETKIVLHLPCRKPALPSYQNADFFLFYCEHCNERIYIYFPGKKPEVTDVETWKKPSTPVKYIKPKEPIEIEYKIHPFLKDSKLQLFINVLYQYPSNTKINLEKWHKAFSEFYNSPEYQIMDSFLPRTKMIFELRYLNKFTIRAIAQKIERSVTIPACQIERTKRKLKYKLQYKPYEIYNIYRIIMLKNVPKTKAEKDYLEFYNNEL